MIIALRGTRGREHMCEGIYQPLFQAKSSIAFKI